MGWIRPVQIKRGIFYLNSSRLKKFLRATPTPSHLFHDQHTHYGIINTL